MQNQQNQMLRHAEFISASGGCRILSENIQEENAEEILNIDDNCVTLSSTLQDDVGRDKKRKTFCSLFSLSSSPRLAFTLSEVLITLGIIGVIAAMTIPNLVDSYQKQATVSGYKKAYSTLTQAVKRSEVDNGEIALWDFPTSRDNATQSTQFFNTYLAPYLSIAKNCGTGSGCWAYTKMPNGGDFRSSGGAYDPTYIKYILNDGMALSIKNYGYLSTIPDNTLRGLGIYVDINGSKNPNTMGKDVFAFVLVEGAAITYNAGNGDLAINIKTGGIYPDGYGSTTHTQYRGCGKDVTYPDAGSYCGAKLIRDGYEIKDDYPW